MEVLYDNIIFNLQKTGGISLYWSELIQRQLHDERLSAFFIERESVTTENMFRRYLPLPQCKIIKHSSVFPLKIERYLPISKTPAFNVFHSSYYRTAFSRTKESVSIVTVHDFIYERYVKGIKKSVHSWQKEKALLNADGIICVSASTKADLLKFHPEVDEKPVKVIHNGASYGYRPVDAVAAYTHLHNTYNIQCPFILYVGSRHSNYKNFDLVVKAVKHTPSYNLVLIGGGELNKADIRLLDSSLQGKYFHLQYIPERELNMFYNTAHCLIYISSYEGFGLPLVEAQKAGCPVVAYSNSSIPELVASKCSLIEELTVNVVKKKIEQLEDLSYRQAVIEEGLANSNNFSWDACYNQTVEFYHEVYQNKNKGDRLNVRTKEILQR
jgi:glycosyltransferase involved in cell wall biosynthesis